MSTVNLFDPKTPSPSSPRNAFDVGYSTLFSSPVGQLLPCYVEDVKAGDKLSLSMDCITRTNPVNTAAFITFDEKVDFWYIPYSLLWSSYEDWRLGQTFPHRTTSTLNVGSQVLLPFTSWSSLSDYLTSISVLPDNSTASYMIFNPNISTSVRYLDLLGYGVPPIAGLMGNLGIFNGSDPVVPSPSVISSLKQYYSSLDTNGLSCNYFRLAAFQCVYMHGYRNVEYEKLDPSYYNMDNLFTNLDIDNVVRINPSSPPPLLSNNYYLAAKSPTTSQPSTLQSRLTWDKLMTPRYKNWRDDIFTTLKPVSGFESGVSGFEFTTYYEDNKPDGILGSSFDWPIFVPNRKTPQGGHPDTSAFDRPNSSFPEPNDSHMEDTYQFFAAGKDYPAMVRQALITELQNSGTPDSYGLTYLYPQNIRNLMAQDSYARASIYADKTFTAQMKALFGESVVDHHRPEYLGSFSNYIQISEVVATSAGSDGTSDASTSVLGEIAGKGLATASDKKIFSRSFDKDGVVIGVHYIMPRNNYDSYRISKFNTKLSRFDYYSPHFDGLGLQPVFAFERNAYLSGSEIGITDKLTSLLGYAPRYYEYKQRTNEVHGAFMLGQPDYDWTLSNNSESVFVGSALSNLKILPNITDRIFALAYNGSPTTDPFKHYMNFNITRVSNLQRQGTPSV
ncbi:major capsid protein [Dipodfec virus UA06Rod_4]|uniref:Major capsid protein n=1 Tax=Dipodfec virus UA06Rod_4 TaxID=2929324 RepID=A0A976N1B1_9VIRU|nr:major capsid protein [Dipodfec virus UA06Rod_4]